MYVVELAFTDDPARLEHRPAHRERLAALHEAGRLRMAGPFADESGSLIVLDVEDEAAVQAVLDDDPYYRAPGVTVRRVAQWRPVVGG